MVLILIDTRWVCHREKPLNTFHQSFQRLFNGTLLFMIELKLRYCMESFFFSFLIHIRENDDSTDVYWKPYVFSTLHHVTHEVTKERGNVASASCLKGPMLSWRRGWKTQWWGCRRVQLYASGSGSWRRPARKKRWLEQIWSLLSHGWDYVNFSVASA